MLSAVVLSLSIAAGAPLLVVAVAALAFWRPLWLLAAAGLWAVLARRRQGRPGPGDEVDFLQGLAAELGAGAALRSAVVAAAARAPALDLGRACRLAGAGLPAEQVGEALQSALPVNGRLAAAAFRLASATGGRVAGLFHSLAGRAAEVGRLERERRALTAQARASAWVVGSLPIALLIMLGITGRAGTLLGTAAGPLVLGVGLGLEAAGVTVVVLMVRRADR
jgi:tight adherence protein B